LRQTKEIAKKIQKSKNSGKNIWSCQKKAVPLHRISKEMMYRGVEQW
jgi:hypothetical protein